MPSATVLSVAWLIMAAAWVALVAVEIYWVISDHRRAKRRKRGWYSGDRLED